MRGLGWPCLDVRGASVCAAGQTLWNTGGTEAIFLHGCCPCNLPGEFEEIMPNFQSEHVLWRHQYFLVNFCRQSTTWPIDLGVVPFDSSCKVRGSLHSPYCSFVYPRDRFVRPKTDIFLRFDWTFWSLTLTLTLTLPSLASDRRGYDKVKWGVRKPNFARLLSEQHARQNWRNQA